MVLEIIQAQGPCGFPFLDIFLLHQQQYLENQAS